MKNCENCEFFSNEEIDPKTNEKWGHCRRRAPNSGVIWRFPIMRPSDWCGEFSPVSPRCHGCRYYDGGSEPGWGVCFVDPPTAEDTPMVSAKSYCSRHRA